jgi:eukaryotic-like serine/threonine-protein kinase
VLLVLLLAGGLFLLARSLGGADQVAVPPTKGMTRVEAEKALAAADLKSSVEERADDTVEAGRVISSDPDANAKVDTETTVKLIVSTGPVQIAVPAVTNQPQAAAEKALTDLGLTPRSATVEKDDVAPGTVVAQNPAAGASVTKGATVDLAVAKASGQELVPDVSGQTLAAAQAALQDKGFRVSTREQPSDSVDRGRVIGTDPPANTSLKKNAVVTIIVSAGKQQVKVPNVTGQTEADATTALRGKGFEVEVTTQALPANDSKDGRVLAQSPTANTTVDAGTTVRIVIGQAAAPTTASTTSTTSSAP